MQHFIGKDTRPRFENNIKWDLKETGYNNDDFVRMRKGPLNTIIYYIKFDNVDIQLPLYVSVKNGHRQKTFYQHI
jgi:hypothetical protein